MEITFLGTSSMQPTKERNQPGLILNYEGDWLLFDCGENIQRQLRIAKIAPTKIKYLLITHLHGDHVLGIPGLLYSMTSNHYQKKLTIIGPPGIKEHIKQLRKTYKTKEMISFEVKEIVGGICVKENKYIIEAKKMKHTTTCLGYKVKEKDKYKINKTYLKKNKIHTGKHLQKLQQGKNIKYEGKIIKAKHATKLVKGKSFAYITDTRPCENAIKTLKETNLAILESTYIKEHEELAKKHYHMTSVEAATIARKAKTKKLVLTHFSQRYKKLDLLLKEAKKVFSKTELAYDFKRTKI